jgi:hypothetical protein
LGSIDEKVNEGAFSLVAPEGPPAMVVSGGVVSGGDAVVLAVQLTVPHSGWFGTTVNVPEAVRTPLNDPVSETALADPEKAWPLIGIPALAIRRGNLQVPGT